MNIEEALGELPRMNERSALVAQSPYTWGSPALIVELTDEYQVPHDVVEAGYEYLLGKEDLERLLRFLSGKRASRRTAAEFVIHFAILDSYPSWIDDIPDR